MKGACLKASHIRNLWSGLSRSHRLLLVLLQKGGVLQWYSIHCMQF